MLDVIKREKLSTNAGSLQIEELYIMSANTTGSPLSDWFGGLGS